ncbi:MAG TPA: hypothetical protein VMZ06_00895 [Candidatus Bathyarchaeia archaeon]|nr:hypothetical protein [Candidatus Bathyarchaeia archaeon]
MLERICPRNVRPLLIADRAFGHPRWLGEIQKRGWDFVQRLSHIHQVCVERHMGTLKELGIRRGWRVRDWGWGTMDEQQFGPVRLVTVFERDADEAWYLVTSLGQNWKLLPPTLPGPPQTGVCSITSFAHLKLGSTERIPSV